VQYEGALYLLATDAGYLDEPSIVWERLNEIDGDTEYVDANFQLVGASERQQTLFSNRQEQPIYDNGPHQQYQQLPTNEDRITSSRDESSREVPSDFDNDGAATTRDEVRAVHATQSAGSAGTRHEDLDPDYLMALRLQEEEEALAQRAKGGSSINIAPRPLEPIGADRDASFANVSESDESYGGGGGGGLRETSESESLPLTSDGQVLMSAEEFEEQRKAELYYAQQKRQLDAQTAHLQQQHLVMENEEQQRRASQVQQQQQQQQSSATGRGSDW
jgi:hypothetical protein